MAQIVEDAGYIEEKLAESFLTDCDEIQRLLAASIKTAKRNLKEAAAN